MMLLAADQPELKYVIPFPTRNLALDLFRQSDFFDLLNTLLERQLGEVRTKQNFILPVRS